MDKSNHSDNVLHRFHPLIARWFCDQYQSPTDIQRLAWRQIQAGHHVLVTAPTGSGKTLTAFLWAINQLACSKLAAGRTRVLYVSPLKALNNDIQRNLLQPLDELTTCFRQAGQVLPEINVLTRSGDTPFARRRQMLRRPPEILITTPESLNLLLASPRARTLLSAVSTLILDEIHAVFGSKRGTYLMTAVERLVIPAGEFQRIALSATVNPLETVAAFVGGYRLKGSPAVPEYEKRHLKIISSPKSKPYRIKVRHPLSVVQRATGESLWDPLVKALKTKIGQNRSTLLFVNNRRLCEKIALKLNQGETEPLAYAHHGSLAREIRQSVERHLKAGRLKAIVATNSLELGIDIGPLEEVLLVQSPPSISAAIQRIGRAGHQVGQVSRGSLYPIHGRDFLEAAVLARHLPDQVVEPQKPVQAPLDVLAQVIVAMTGVDTWDLDELYNRLKTCYAFRNLSRNHFDLVLQMLAGKYAMSRLRDLKPRVAIDGPANTVCARKGALQAVYLSGGVIPDRGYYQLRHARTGARIGELDEEFVWEARVGQTFSLGTQRWQIEKITAGEVRVTSGHPQALDTPFWKGEGFQRDWSFSEKILSFLQEAEQGVADAAWRKATRRRCHLEPAAAEALFDFLKRQKEALKGPLPHRHHLVVERVHTAPGATPGHQVVLLTFWGGKINQPLALALDAAWHQKFGQRLEIFAGNDAIALQLPHAIDAADLLALVNNRNLDTLLRRRLETSGIFGARFRECAGRALLLTRTGFKKRMPLWMSRLRSQKLFDAVRGYDDFPMLLEAWRTCLQDEFDLERLRILLTELETGTIAWTEVHSALASPMSQQMAWRQINTYMYRDDTPRNGRPSNLSDDLLHEIVHSPALRPSVSKTTVDRFQAKSLRLLPEYTPADGRELVEWVKERLLIPAMEWRSLLDLMAKVPDREPGDPAVVAASRLARLQPPRADAPLIVAREMVAPIVASLPMDASVLRIDPYADETVDVNSRPSGSGARAEETPAVDLTWLLGEWLQFFGPLTADFIAGTLGIDPPHAVMALDQLVDERQLIFGRLIKDQPETVYCDARNFEMMLRMERRAAQPVIAPLPCEALAPFLATVQGVIHAMADGREPVERLLGVMDQMSGYVLAAPLWESEVLPARLPAYDPAWLDSLMQSSDLKWLGRPDRHLMFCFQPDLDLVIQAHQGLRPGNGENDNAAAPPPSTAKPSMDQVLTSSGRFDFSTLLDITGLTPARASDELWMGVWQGRYSNDAFTAMRLGIANGFKAPQINASARSGLPSRRARAGSAFLRWKAALPRTGNWFKITYPKLDDDLLVQQERRKERVRLLLDRYGVLFRELLTRELPMFRWTSLLKTLRLMDLSGEIHSGCFFQGISGLQFIAPRVLSLLQRKKDTKPIYWLNAMDPASVCGLGLASLQGKLPSRLASNHLVYRGDELAAVSMRRGRIIVFHIAPDDPDLVACLGFLHHLLNRTAQPLRSITVETINGCAATDSPYLPFFMDAFDVVRDPGSITLYRRIQ